MKNMTAIKWLDSVDSTNNEAKRTLEQCDNLSVLSAMSQTAGKGQRGNTWSSESGKNLLFSIVLKFGNIFTGKFRAYDQSAISEMTSLCIVDFLSRYGIKASVKWPNDIYVGEKKICGILIENSVQEIWLSSSIIGIGLNINQRNFNVNIPNPTSMALESPAGDEFDIKECLEIFMETFEAYYSRYFNIKGGFTTLRTMYLSQLWRKDEVHTYRDVAADSLFEGIIRGVSNVGNLLVEDLTAGCIREFGFKEIGYIL